MTLSVDREMDKEFHFPFSILDLIFAIAPEIAQFSLSAESRAPLAMANIKSKMENGKCFSSRFRDSLNAPEPLHCAENLKTVVV
jgi:hypothetical protein